MFDFQKGDRVTVIVASKGDNILEYVGTFSMEQSDTIELTDVDISYLLMNIQRGIFGGNASKYAEGIDRVVINKNFIISCNK